MNKALVVGGLIFAVLGLLLWYGTRPVEGVQAMGDEKSTLAWIGLATSVTGLATSVVTLIATMRK
jgi:hypothetical protein